MTKYSPSLAALVFLAIALACKLRVIELGNNFALFGALAIFCGAYLRGFAAWTIPLFGIVLGDFLGDWLQVPGVNRYDFRSMMFTYAGFSAMVLMGHLLRWRDSADFVFGTALLGSVAFFVLSNFGSWLDPIMNYDRTPSGLLSCYWMAIPFFKYTLLSDVIFTMLFVAIHRMVLSYTSVKARVSSHR